MNSAGLIIIAAFTVIGFLLGVAVREPLGAVFGCVVLVALALTLARLQPEEAHDD